MPRSSHGGRHELGQNFLHHRPTVQRIVSLVDPALGPILEIGAGSGAITTLLATLGPPVTALELDEHRARALRRALPSVSVLHTDALRHPFDAPTIVGNVPFHLTTPLLRRILGSDGWAQCVLLTQWEVARKRASVGGGTLLSAQGAPWFEFELCGRVPSWCFTPVPSVDGGILRITRRRVPLVASAQRRHYETFAREVFNGGRSLAHAVGRAGRVDTRRAGRALRDAGLTADARARDIRPEQWPALWASLRR